MENYEQIFDSHISQTFLNLLGGSEKDTIQSNMGEESMVMATPRRRRVEPEIEKDLEAKSDKVAEMKENPGLEFVIGILISRLTSEETGQCNVLLAKVNLDMVWKLNQSLCSLFVRDYADFCAMKTMNFSV